MTFEVWSEKAPFRVVGRLGYASICFCPTKFRYLQHFELGKRGQKIKSILWFIIQFRLNLVQNKCNK